MTVLENYLPLFDPNIHNIIANTPRASAKSTSAAQMASHLIAHTCKRSPHDIVIFRANANSLEGSVMQEVEDWLDAFGLDYTPHKGLMRLEVGPCNIYFLGVSGHDRSRVRGFKPKNKLIAIIGDECQQISYEENLKHALSTFRRYLDTEAPYKVLLCGNPHEIKGHWWNVYTQKMTGRYTKIQCTWRDLAKNNLLNRDVIDDILLEKKINPALYRFMYEGDLSDLSGGAYPSFNRDVHLISPETAADMTRGERIEAIIWGGDGAIMNDATGICPIAVMTSGRGFVLKRFFYDPQKSGRTLAPSEIAELVQLYLDDMEDEYNIIRDGVITSAFAIDCAAADLITQLRYTIPDYHAVISFTNKNVIRNNSVINNCFARNMLYVIDYGGYKDYLTGRWVECEDPLADQLESVVWKNNRLDPAIRNDLSDALTYGACVFYENPENLYLPERKKYYEQYQRSNA